MKILLIDNYDSFTYNLYHYISKFKKNVDVIRNDKIDGKTILRKKYSKIVISPGPGNPNQAGNCLKIVKEVHKKIPILGVCLGHQIIGQVFGGKIIKAKNLMHGKTSKIRSKKIGILKNLPKTSTFKIWSILYERIHPDPKEAFRQIVPFPGQKVYGCWQSAKQFRRRSV
jgi:anthranilate synthase component 2